MRVADGIELESAVAEVEPEEVAPKIWLGLRDMVEFEATSGKVLGLTGMLNNCGLYAVTVEICKEILKRAEVNNKDKFYVAYERLRGSFIKYYGLDDSSWADIVDLLKDFNPFDIYMVFGPVLRSFIQKQLDEPAGAVFRAAYPGATIERFYTPRQELNGRYDSLAPDVLSALVCQPLGLSLSYTPLDGVAHALPTEDSTATVNIFHNGADGPGAHWERTPDAANIKYFSSSSEGSKLAAIADLFNLDVSEYSSFALELMKASVKTGNHSRYAFSGQIIGKYIYMANMMSQRYSRQLLQEQVVKALPAASPKGKGLPEEVEVFVKRFPGQNPYGSLIEKVIRENLNYQFTLAPAPRQTAKSGSEPQELTEYEIKMMLFFMTPLQLDFPIEIGECVSDEVAPRPLNVDDVSRLHRQLHPRELAALLDEKFEAIMANEPVRETVYRQCLDKRYFDQLPQAAQEKLQAQPEFAERKLLRDTVMTLSQMVNNADLDKQGISKLNYIYVPLMIAIPVIGWLILAVNGLLTTPPYGVNRLRESLPTRAFPDQNDEAYIWQVQRIFTARQSRTGLFSHWRRPGTDALYDRGQGLITECQANRRRLLANEEFRRVQ